MKESKNPKKWIIPVAVWCHFIIYHTNSPDVVLDVPTILIVIIIHVMDMVGLFHWIFTVLT
jgi:hypothetical protein